jgi:hypothetical protein
MPRKLPTDKGNPVSGVIATEDEGAKREVVRMVAASLGREPQPHELHPQLLRLLNSDQELQREVKKKAQEYTNTVKRIEKHLKVGSKHREEVRKQLGFMEPQSFTRPDAPSLERGLMSSTPVRLPDTLEIIERRDVARGIIQTRERPMTIYGFNGEILQEYAKDQPMGIVGTPMMGGIPYVEDQVALYPYRARGFGYDPGALGAYHRHDSDVNEGVANLVAVFAGATIEAQPPEYLSPSMVKMLGIDKDLLLRACDEFNASFQLGRWANGMTTPFVKEQVMTAIINGASVAEIGLDPTAGILDRIKWISPRSPNTWMRWMQDPYSGKPIAIQQTPVNAQVRQPSMWMDLDRCMHIAIDRMGDNFEGISLLRAAYAWDLLTTEMIASILVHIQRWGGGLPIVKDTKGGRDSQDAAAKASEAIAEMAATNRSFLQLGYGSEFELLQMQLQGAGITEVFEACRAGKRSALRMALAGMGQDGSVGSHALATTKDDQWLRGLRTFASDIECGLNQLLGYYARNVWDVDALGVLPVLKITGYAQKDATVQLALQRDFIALRGDLQYNDEELREIADDTGVVWKGRGASSDSSDTASAENGAVLGDAAATTTTGATDTGQPTVPVEPLQVGSLQSAVAIIQSLSPSDPKITPVAPGVAVELLVAAGVPLDSAKRMVAAQVAAAPEPEYKTPGEPAATAIAEPNSQLPQSNENAAQTQEPAQTAAEPADAPQSQPETAGDDGDDDGDPDPQPRIRSVPEKYQQIDRTIPKAAKRLAKAGLAMRKDGADGGTQAGWNRARDIMNLSEFSVEEWVEIAAWFDRHNAQARGEGWNPGEGGYPSPQRVAFNLWGGDAMKRKADQVRRQKEAADAKEQTRCSSRGCTDETHDHSQE